MTIAINDDGPTAVNDGPYSPAEDTAIDIDAKGNDVSGADGVDWANGGETASVYVSSDPGKGTVVYNGDGTFTYTPTAGAEGDDSFKYTIVDGDGDKSEATVTISLATDSIPTVSVTDGVVAEAALSDGSDPLSPAETTTGEFTVTTGNDSGTLYVQDKDGDWISINSSGDTVVDGQYGVLTVTAGVSGYTWSYTLSDNTLDHTDTVVDADSDRGADDQVFDNFATKVVDTDGDSTADNGISASETLTIAINDDGPSIIAPNSVLSNQPNVVLTAELDVDYGADGGVLAFAGASVVDGVIKGTYIDGNGAPQVINLTYNSESLYYDQVSTTEWIAKSSTIDVEVFKVSLDSINKSYTVEMFQQVDAIVETVSFRVNDQIDGGIATARVYEDEPSGLSMRVSADTNNLAPTGTETGNVDKVNTNASWFGTGNQTINQDQALILEFADNNSWSADGEKTNSYSAASLSSISFTTIGLDSAEELEWVAYNSNGAPLDFATEWTVLRYSSYVEAEDGSVIGVGNPDVLTIDNGGIVAATVTVNGLSLTGWQIDGEGVDGNNTGYYVLTSGSDFTSIAIEAGAESAFDLGNVDVTRIGSTYDVTTLLDISSVDNDGDFGADTISITFGNGEALTGSGEHDVLQGGSGDDILIGGFGDDIMTGGLGSDTFKYLADDLGSGVDTIADFKIGSGGDILDLTDLFDTAPDRNNLDDYLKIDINATGSSTTIDLSVDVDGAGAEAPVKLSTITLDGFASDGTTNATDVLDAMESQIKTEMP